MTDEEIGKIADANYARYQDWQVDLYAFARAIKKAAEAAAIERCAELIDGMNDSAGDRASYDNSEMHEGEVERMHALSDAANAIRALLPKEE